MELKYGDKVWTIGISDAYYGSTQVPAMPKECRVVSSVEVWMKGRANWLVTYISGDNKRYSRLVHADTCFPTEMAALDELIARDSQLITVMQRRIDALSGDISSAMKRQFDVTYPDEIKQEA
jgi:hypothetical protein